MLTSGMDGLVHIWDVTLTENVQELPEILATISIPDKMKISFLAYSAEHDLLLTAGFGSDVVISAEVLTPACLTQQAQTKPTHSHPPKRRMRTFTQSLSHAHTPTHTPHCNAPHDLQTDRRASDRASDRAIERSS